MPSRLGLLGLLLGVRVSLGRFFLAALDARRLVVSSGLSASRLLALLFHCFYNRVSFFIYGLSIKLIKKAELTLVCQKPAWK